MDNKEVSIHAPREGCDVRWRRRSPPHPRFNSRTPGGVRLEAISASLRRPMFQFTHPGRGATGGRYGGVERVGVSIHAPREGCDRTPRAGRPYTRGFNSRTPGGVRRAVIILWASRLACFNSRTPGGVRQRRGFRRIYPQRFQFTHPGRGATGSTQYDLLQENVFQFTHPGRGATTNSNDNNNNVTVSIHAPREGCDECHFLDRPLY